MHPLFGDLYVISENLKVSVESVLMGYWFKAHKDQLFLSKTLPICYHLIFQDVVLFYKILHGLTELPFSAYSIFKVTSSRKSTILSTIVTAKKWQTEKFFFHRVGKSVNELIHLGVDPLRSLRVFQEKSQGFSLSENCFSLTVVINLLNSFM